MEGMDLHCVHSLYGRFGEDLHVRILFLFLELFLGKKREGGEERQFVLIINY